MNIFLKTLDSNNKKQTSLKTYLLTITTLRISEVFLKVDYFVYFVD